MLRHSGSLVCLLATFAVSCSGRESQPTLSSGPGLDDLRRFTSEDKFLTPAQEVFPHPAKTPKLLWEYAATNYESTLEVRRALAVYFLKYESVLLERGLLTIAGEKPNLIFLLWEMEAAKNPSLLETPSTLAMREHLQRAPAHFATDEEVRRMIRENSVKHLSIVAEK